mgnify:CR=1 FL=1
MRRMAARIAFALVVTMAATENARADGWGPTCSTCGERRTVRSYFSGCRTCIANHYRTNSCLYGYQDHVYGRGPVIDLGSATLQPGFRGYGVLGNVGYGLGMWPQSRLDRQAEDEARARIKYPVLYP